MGKAEKELSETVILVVDDEESIRRTLLAVLSDEGFHAVAARGGEDALNQIKARKPALVLLDIWMPGMDGIETLTRIKQFHADLPVIMISGHATISSALQATRLGAEDFIEKPLDLDNTMRAVKKVLGLTAETDTASVPVTQEVPETLRLGPGHERLPLQTAVFQPSGWRGRKVPQRTLANSALLYGHGVHTGQKSGLILEPLGPDSGIHFVGIPSGLPVPAHVSFVDSTGYATTIRSGETQVGTIEHLMSALHAYGITNLLVKCNGEVPVMDGSTLEFCRLIEQVGLENQPGDWYEIEVRHPVRVGNEVEYMLLEPADEFSVEYILQYPEPIGRQELRFVLRDPESYRREIAPARTFGFVRDIGALQKRGLALGGRFDNFVLIGDEGAINADLRFPDEPVRHKILDVIGDLYLLGRPIRGKVTACMTGHSDNVALLRALLKAFE